MDLLNGLVQHLEQRIGTFYNDIIKSSDKTSSQPVEDERYYWPVATPSILDADEQYKERRKALAAAQATYSTLVQQRLEAAKQLSILKQQRAKLPDKHDHLENQMRKVLCDYMRFDADVFEAREVLFAAKKEDVVARSTGVAVFTGTSDTERLRLCSQTPVRAGSPTQTYTKDGVTKERRATLRSMSATRVLSYPSSHARVPSTESSSSSASSSNQFQRVRSSPRDLIKTVSFAMTPEDDARSAMRATEKKKKHGGRPTGTVVANKAARPQIQRSLSGAEVHARLQYAASSRCGHPQAPGH
jgi:hypothetical protein